MARLRSVLLVRVFVNPTPYHPSILGLGLDLRPGTWDWTFALKPRLRSSSLRHSSILGLGRWIFGLGPSVFERRSSKVRLKQDQGQAKGFTFEFRPLYRGLAALVPGAYLRRRNSQIVPRKSAHHNQPHGNQHLDFLVQERAPAARTSARRRSSPPSGDAGLHIGPRIGVQTDDHVVPGACSARPRRITDLHPSGPSSSARSVWPPDNSRIRRGRTDNHRGQ